MSGPSASRVRALLSKVRSVTTDYGAERRISDERDILLQYLANLSLPVLSSDVPQEHLFPLALHAPRLCRIYDGILRRICCSIREFPGWLVQAKALVKLLRSYSKEFVRELRQKNEHASADILGRGLGPSCAQWRWTTLDDICLLLMRVFSVLANKFHILSRVGKIRDSIMIQTVRKALFSDDKFPILLKFIARVAGVLRELAGQVKGCPCHADPRRNYLPTPCVWTLVFFLVCRP